MGFIKLNNQLTLSSKHKFLIIVFSAILIELLLIIFDIFNGDGSMPLYMFIYFEVFILFSLAFFILKTRQRRDEEKSLHLFNIPIFIIITGIIFRITLI